MYKLFFLLAFAVAAPALACAQPTSNRDEGAVQAAIDRVFAGMHASDSALVQATFMPDAQLKSVENKQGVVSVRTEEISHLAGAIGKFPKGSLDERLTGMNLKIDGDLATVWTPYEFFTNGKSQYCGANAFTLVRMAQGWKIQAIIDARRKCK